MPKLDRNGNIIRPLKQAPPVKHQPETPPDEEEPTSDLAMVSVRDSRRGLVRDQPEEKQLPVMYDFVIQCATLAPAGFDMNVVCSHCPFKATKCVNTLLFPNEEDMVEIAHILMKK